MREMILAELRRWGKTAQWSWQGWAATWTREKSLRQWAALNAASAVLALILNLTGAERAIVLALGLLILVAELVNTAIEETVDFVSTEHDPRAGRAKDAGSAAVAVTAVAWAVAWLAVLVG
jgi:diacylglycerol kinase (ATP)